MYTCTAEQAKRGDGRIPLCKLRQVHAEFKGEVKYTKEPVEARTNLGAAFCRGCWRKIYSTGRQDLLAAGFEYQGLISRRRRRGLE